MDFKFDRADFQANLADDTHGSMLPLKIGGVMVVEPGRDIKSAWDFAYAEACEWAASKGLTIASAIIKPIRSDEKQEPKPDPELEAELLVFSSFKTKEDAELYQKTSSFKYHIKVKELIQSLPSKKDGKKD